MVCYPRRARLLDLGRSGWNDLAWLLELNQGYYNAASLAAVCSIAEDPSVSWLGKPIHPAVGNERLEPLVTALPVSTLGFDDGLKNPSTREKPEASPPLTIIGAKMIGLRPNLKRDAQGLYNNEEMKGLKILSMCVAFVLVVIGTLLLSQGQVFSGLAVYYVTGFAFVIVELLIGTMYLEREGWIFLPEAQWPGDPQECLGEQDSNLRTLVNWGQRQLVPEWEAPRRRRWFKGKLVDLRNRVWVDTIAVGHPNAMMPLAIHGGGVTCMLLDRAKDLEMDVTLGSQKVGMTNLPPYALSQTVKIGSMSVGSHP
ncbi:hypothetical protein C8J57DRAFT_1096626 [Mycena rebaudengoi]|nr:hypothetical protein C8J57DRAFT_1096626 [Mycena rebaudengoi]